MTLESWLTVVAVCSLGAMSPGPSLAVVLRHTLNGGRKQGCLAALAHGFGVGMYAWLCISGVALLITNSPRMFLFFQWAGAAYLAWMGILGLRAKAPHEETAGMPNGRDGAARDGFLIVFLNPKIAVFFIALFSQLVGSETTWLGRLGYAATAGTIDALWYVLVAWLFSAPRWLHKLQANAVWLNRLFGIILLALAVRLVLETLL